MARYEGMDEILQRLSLRFGQESPATAPQVESALLPSPVSGVATERIRHRAAAESIDRLRREAVHLHEILIGTEAQQYSEQEKDELLALLGTVLHDLWSCETALQRVAPID
jgi:hypothetical protein